MFCSSHIKEIALTNSRPWSLMVTSALPNLLKEMKYNIVYKSLVTYDYYVFHTCTSSCKEIEQLL